MLNNVAFGVFVGFEIAILFAWLFDRQISSAPQLLTASAALLGASFAVAGVLISIENQNQLAENNRQRSLAAANATLPLALTYLSEISRKGAQYTISSAGTDRVADDLIAELSIPSETLSTIQKAIEFASPHDAQKLSKLVSSFQVSHSRTSRWLIEERHPLFMHLGHSVDWALLHRKIESCFSYARGEENSIPNELSSLRLEQFYSVQLNESCQTIEQLQPAIEQAEARYQRTNNLWS